MIVFNYICLLSLGPFGRMGPFGTRFEIYLNKCLEELVDQHWMFKKLTSIQEMSKMAPEVTVKAAFNAWDCQMEGFTKNSEKKGHGKVFAGKYDSSPIFSFYLQRVWLWRCTREHKWSPFPDPHNLYWDLKAEGYPKPRDMSLEMIDARIVVLENKLDECKKQAVDLRKDHLDRWLDCAKG